MLLKNVFIALFLALSFISHVFSYDLYTLNKKGKHLPILNRRNGITKRYEGGIYISRPKTVTIIHKRIDPTYFKRGVDLNKPPLPPAPQPGELDTLWTKNTDGLYIPILNRRNGVTKRYRGGIWFMDRVNNQLVNIHKLPDPTYFNRRVTNNQPIPHIIQL